MTSSPAALLLPLAACVTAALVISFVVPDASAQETTSPHETIVLWPDGAPDDNGLSGPEEPYEPAPSCIGNISEATLTIHHPDPDEAIGAAIVVLPGGGYSVVCGQHEGSAIVKWLTGLGFTAGTLKYRLPNGHHQVPLQDAQQALRLMRERAHQWQVAPDKIGVLGFSAGGHLASTVGTHFTEDFSDGQGDHLNLSHRPDFMVLVYPVITMMDDLAHQGTRRQLLGPDPTDAQIRRFSNHLNVTDQTPPTYLVHSSDDRSVHPFNSMAFYTSLIENGVAAELHLFELGGHGYGLSKESPARAWEALAEPWLRRVVNATPKGTSTDSDNTSHK